MPLHVSALGGAAARSARIGVSFSFCVTVERMRSTVDWSWSSWHSISNSISPIFIFMRMGGFAFVCVNFSPCCY